MGANSLPRRAIKRLVRPLLRERYYGYVQAAVMAWDVRTGSRSEPEVSLIPVAVEEGDAVVDIGANYGLYTYHLSRAVGPTGTVYAFEPVPFTVGTLCLVAKLLRLRNVQIVPKGCSNETTTLAFAVPVQPSGAIAGGLAHIHDRDDHERYDPPPGSTGVQRVVCEVVALDDFLRPAQDLTFIKCDIEGAELLAFRGCERTIGRFRPTVLCEINPHFLARFDLALHDLLGFFCSKQYGIYRYDSRSQRLIELSEEAVDGGNYLFIHPSRRDRVAHLFA